MIRLMEADDTLEVVARLGAMTREPKRISTTERDLAR
jgi:hypothetical protein